MIETWIGCSGFHYKEWKDVFYPKGLSQNKWFWYYAQHFNTLELNNTFYRFPRLQTLQNWYTMSPSVYRFSVKAPRLITHYKQFRDTQRMLADFYGTTREGLQDKLGCVLFQLPNRIIYSEEMLDRMIVQMDPTFQNVIEFRDRSWWQKKVYAKLAKHHIHFCSVSYSGLDDHIITNSPLIYYRFHGIPKLYKSTYKKDTILNVGEQISMMKKTKNAFIYFNNTWGTGALKNARQLLKYCNETRNKNSFSFQKSP